MPKYWFDHVHLLSPDPVKTAEFYENLFGVTREGVQTAADGRTSVGLIMSKVPIKVLSSLEEPRVPGGVSSGLEHFGFATDDLDAAVAELKSQGVKFLQEIRTIPGARLTFFLGPEDTPIELLQRD
ncbi:VOC family protein [Chloroflexota bacterium]